MCFAVFSFFSVFFCFDPKILLKKLILSQKTYFILSVKNQLWCLYFLNTTLICFFGVLVSFDWRVLDLEELIWDCLGSRTENINSFFIIQCSYFSLVCSRFLHIVFVLTKKVCLSFSCLQKNLWFDIKNLSQDMN